MKGRYNLESYSTYSTSKGKLIVPEVSTVIVKNQIEAKLFGMIKFVENSRLVYSNIRRLN